MAESIDGASHGDAATDRVTPTTIALLAIKQANTEFMAAKPGTEVVYTPQMRQNLLNLMPANFLTTNLDEFMTATFIMMQGQNNAEMVKTFDEILASTAMMQAEPGDCALVIGRIVSRLPIGCREEKSTYILKGDFGKHLADKDPASYSGLVVALSEDTPSLIERREIGTYERKLSHPYTNTQGSYMAMTQHNLSAIFVRPTLGLPPLVEIKQHGVATHIVSVGNAMIKDVPTDITRHLGEIFTRRAAVIEQSFPQAAAALRASVQKLALAA